jgi:hypothetical protein
MAATWLWNLRRNNRQLGEPVVVPFCYQPLDVTDPVESEVSEIIRSLDVWDETSDILRVDLKQVKPAMARLYQGLYPDWETSMTQEKLDALEGSVKIMLHHLKVQDD